jgi:sodium-independent sulfate anion transporter 11
VYRYWEVSPPEVVIFFAGVLVTIFTNIENGIYVAIGISAGLLLFRIAKADGNFLGSVKTYTVDLNNRLEDRPKQDASQAKKEVFIPYNHSDGSNPNVHAQSPYPGVFIFRFSEGFSYANQSRYLDIITQQVFAETRRTTLENHERIGVSPNSLRLIQFSASTNHIPRTAHGMTQVPAVANKLPPPTTAQPSAPSF